MPVTNTDAVLWYKVGIFGKIGYGVPNPSDDLGSLNPQINDLVDIMGRNLFSIMHHEDIDLRTPPSINTLTRIHRLYLRTAQILDGRSVAPGTPNLETDHVQPGGEIFRVYPVPYFLVRNKFMKRWSALVMMAISEAMQHTENRKTMEISKHFAGSIGKYMTRVYTNMAIELFGKSSAEVSVPGFRLTDADLGAYNPAEFFTSTEMVDTVPPLSHVLTEDRLAVLSEGILLTDLPELQPWPVNLPTFYASLEGGDSNAVDRQLGEAGAGFSGGGGSASSGPIMPPPPGP